MSEHDPSQQRPYDRSPRVTTLPARTFTAGQVAGALAGAVAVALAAMAVTLALLASTARAEPLSVDAVLAALEARADALRDIAFVLEGELRDEAGQRFAVEVEVLAIPQLQALSLYTIQPDALADNMIIVADGEVRNYTFLTNQVAIYTLDDPDAFGGLLPAGDALVLDLDLAAVFAGWAAEVVSVEPGGDGDVYTLRFDNLDSEAMIHHVIVVVDGGDWLPQRLAFFAGADEPFADVRLIGVEVDAGLDVADVTWLPADAEVLDRRR